MMSFLLRDNANPIHKLERLFEVGEFEFALQMVGFDDIPTRHVFLKDFNGRTFKCGDIPATWDAFFLSETFGHGNSLAATG